MRRATSPPGKRTPGSGPGLDLVRRPAVRPPRSAGRRLAHRPAKRADRALLMRGRVDIRHARASAAPGRRPEPACGEGLADSSSPTTIQSDRHDAKRAERGLEYGAYESYEKGREATVSCACHWTVNMAASAEPRQLYGGGVLRACGGRLRAARVVRSAHPKIWPEWIATNTFRQPLHGDSGDGIGARPDQINVVFEWSRPMTGSPPCRRPPSRSRHRVGPAMLRARATRLSRDSRHHVVIAGMLAKDANLDDVRCYYRALRRARRDIDFAHRRLVPILLARVARALSRARRHSCVRARGTARLRSLYRERVRANPRLVEAASSSMVQALGRSGSRTQCERRDVRHPHPSATPGVGCRRARFLREKSSCPITSSPGTILGFPATARSAPARGWSSAPMSRM